MDDSAVLLEAGVLVGPERHRFRLTTELGPHPYGTLWQAEDQASSGRPTVTLLFLPDVLTRQPEFIERLRKLIIVCRKCKHANALDCYGLFNFKGLIFLAFEAVDGLTLADMFATGKTAQLKPMQKQGLLIQMGKAMDAFHREIHKSHASLAPELVFISSKRGVRVMMISWRHVVDDYLDLIPGKPTYRQYQAPEGFDPQPTSLRSDVYAFAALTYQLYADKPAFLPDDDEKARFQRELKAPNSLTAKQWSALQSALNPDQQSRPASILELLKALFSEEETVAASTPEDTNSDSPTASKSNRVINAISGLKKRLPTGWLQRFQPVTRLLNRIPVGPRLIGALLFSAGLLLGLLISLLLQKPDPQQQQAIQALTEQRNQLQQELEQIRVSPQTTQGPSTEVPVDEMTQPLPAQNESETAAVESPTLPSPAAQDTSRQALDQPGDLARFRDYFGENSFAPVMQTLPQDTFLMGDLNRMGDDNERPVRTVSIDYTFALGVHEVTFEEYDQFALATNRPLPDDAGWGRGARPVINVSWQDAQAYTSWLAAITGEPYRLPTEAEWEYAARAGTISAWWWGNELVPAMAVCDECGTQWDGQQTAPVGQLPANAWGLKDMHGNVDEWVQDCYSDNYLGAPEDGSAMLSGDCSYRVMRGGSWFELARLTRSSSRYRHPPDTARNTWGFRVALDLPAPISNASP
ncbi:SUMF1/EgtB/PvdO family nonheme iron enzyme [Nitrincola sp.]|uniref:SUMF1/EgtB/PvdO family nonheme iron enzyme n=1 Tax=Nitrincola sp. TaxID=1926584 RepID=UPI003A8D494A